MKSTRRSVALRKLLDLCDDLQRLRARLVDVELTRDVRTRLKRQLRNKCDRLARDLAGYRFKGPLGRLLREYRLDFVHFQVLAALLHRHLRAESPAVEGRVLLAAIFDSSFDVLAGMELLHENGVLRMSGLVVLDDDEQRVDDVLEARYRLSDETLIAFRDEVAGLVVDAPRGPLGGYGSNHEFLLDLRTLHNLYKHRSERMFQQDRWDRIHAGVGAPALQVSRRIEAAWQRLERRLEATPDVRRLPAARFFREHGLDRLETVIVVHLLFRELYEGNAYADVVELIRLVSADELDLLRNRRILLEGSALRRAEILEVEPLLEGRVLTGEAHLADWVTNHLLGAVPDGEAIGSDDRLDWHLYLKNLEDAGTFFRDLEAN
jgi:hypothetical protein